MTDCPNVTFEDYESIDNLHQVVDGIVTLSLLLASLVLHLVCLVLLAKNRLLRQIFINQAAFPQ